MATDLPAAARSLPGAALLGLGAALVLALLTAAAGTRPCLRSLLIAALALAVLWAVLGNPPAWSDVSAWADGMLRAVASEPAVWQ